MRLLQSAFGVLLLGFPVGACAMFDASGDCRKNPTMTCDGQEGGAGAGTTAGPPSCDDGVQNGEETGVDCGAGCGPCNGEPCAEAIGCKSGFCADGVCCDTACDGPCAACDVDGSKGTCSPLSAGANDPGNSACDMLGGCGEVAGYCLCTDGVKNGDEADVDCGGVCGACGIGATCASNADCAVLEGAPNGHCVDGRCCHTTCQSECMSCGAEAHPGLCLPVAYGTEEECMSGKVCNATGLCAFAEKAECSDHGQCATNHCVTAPIGSGLSKWCAECAQDTDCAAGHSCMAGACLAKADDGAPCQSDARCEHGHCVDGVCCSTKCSEKCKACHKDYTGQPTGTCAPISEGLDPRGECNGPGGAAACDGSGSCGEP